MKLLEIEVKNLKSITYAKLTFTKPARPRGGWRSRRPHSSAVDSIADYQVSLLYGDNGAGKTTILEAISLLGHVSTMSRIYAAGGIADPLPSLFRLSKARPSGDVSASTGTTLRALNHETYDHNAFNEQLRVIRGAGLAAWWAAPDAGGNPQRPARVRYRINFDDQPIEFYISFLQSHDLSITEALSRDQKSPGEKIHDGNMDNSFAIVCDETQRSSVERFVSHMLAISPHSYWSEGEKEYQTDPRTTSRAAGHSMVAYWNTDLNDFGRKNDLRESVKKIRIDFTGQMIDRLGLALPYGGPEDQRYHAMSTSEVVSSKKLDALNASLKNALVDHAVAMQAQWRDREHGLIRITEIDATSAGPAAMKARRASESKDIEIDHLSAGENESVFIFLLMHGMPCRDSIILLDEPDLHLSDFAKPSFYKELYRIAEAYNCQLIISTHSAFAYGSVRSEYRSHHFLRRDEVDRNGMPTVVHRTSWDDHFGELLAFHYVSCAVNAMSEAGFLWKALAVPFRALIWVGKKSMILVWTVITYMAAGVILYALAATLNDAFFITGRITPDVHRMVIRVAAFICVVTTVTAVFWRIFIGALPRR